MCNANPPELCEFSYFLSGRWRAIDLSGDSPYTLGRVWKELMRQAAAIARRSRKAARLEARVTAEQKKLVARRGLARVYGNEIRGCQHPTGDRGDQAVRASHSA